MYETLLRQIFSVSAKSKSLENIKIWRNKNENGGATGEVVAVIVVVIVVVVVEL